MQMTAVREKDIVASLMANGSFNILVKCLRATDMVRVLADTSRTFTFFAPCERAFKALVPGGELRALLDDKPRLIRVIRYHVIPGRRITPEHADGHFRVRTLEGTTVLIDASAGFRVNDANVIRSDIPCSNGVIHEIDSVLLPG